MRQGFKVSGFQGFNDYIVRHSELLELANATR